MTGQALPSRFDRVGRAPAAAILALLLAVLVYASWPSGPSAASAPRLRGTYEQSDAAFYRSVIRRVHSGENYYPAAADELRKGHYPLRPFITFRLPTAAYAYAWLGESVMVAIEGLLVVAVIALWYLKLKPIVPFWQRAAAILLLTGGTAALVQPVTGLFHESWAALLMALMLVLRRPGHAAGAIVAGGVALMIRETALPMILAMGALALVERRWREAAGWAATLIVFGAYLAFHAHMVAGVVRPDDLASPGWNAMLGPRFALRSLAMVSAVTILPAAVSGPLLVLSLFGWASVAAQWAVRAALLLLGYAAMLAMFARADTFYWALLAAPLSLVGLAFVPTAMAALVAALDGRGGRVAQLAP